MTSFPICTVCDTVNAIDAEPVRPRESVTVTGSDFEPGDVEMLTVAANMKVLPEPLRACAGEPPIDDRSAVTASPVLVGFVPGVTVTDSAVASPWLTDAGLAV